MEPTNVGTQSDAGQSQESSASDAADQGTQTSAHLPEKMQGKSVEEVAKMAMEAERKLGETSGELGNLRKFQTDMDPVLRAIYADPELFNKVDAKVRELNGQPLKEDKAAEDTKDKSAAPDPALTDTRRAMEAQIINDFEVQNGIDQLPADKRKEMHTAVGVALADMVDPGGRLTYQEILNAISLTKLPRFLANAYLIANRDNLVDKSKLEALQNRRNKEASSIPGLPSSGTVDGSVELTSEERDTARKMKIPEDKYLQRKKEILGVSE